MCLYLNNSSGQFQKEDVMKELTNSNATCQRVSRKPFAKKTLMLSLVACFVMPLMLPAMLLGQDEARANELSERQRRWELKMAELEATFEIIAQKLEETEPERAAILKEALNQAKDRLIKRCLLYTSPSPRDS